MYGSRSSNIHHPITSLLSDAGHNRVSKQGQIFQRFGLQFFDPYPDQDDAKCNHENMACYLTWWILDAKKQCILAG